MTSDEYTEIARSALDYLNNPQLHPRQRRLAHCLHELARLLSDPEYGCPTEALAVCALHQHLQQLSLPAKIGSGPYETMNDLHQSSAARMIKDQSKSLLPVTAAPEYRAPEKLRADPPEDISRL